ncbi:hypothetical protein C8R47DRAFT_1326454 [Mycena vitilis]|nr:hypothetical protein C8R47DRAFT_1326454 [Mycena vitilis]
MVLATSLLAGLALARLATAAPGGFLMRASSASSPLSPAPDTPPPTVDTPPIVKVDPATWFKNNVVFDSSCSATQKAHVQQAVEDAITITLVAQSMQATDAAFNRYFLPSSLVIVDEDPNDPEERDFPVVKKMYHAILTATQKIAFSCPTLDAQPKKCAKGLALTQVDITKAPAIEFCPNFFKSEETIPALKDRPFTPTGWCPGGRWHNSGDFSTEVGIEASEVTNAETGEKVMEGGTEDIIDMDDENDTNPATIKLAYSGGDREYAPLAAITLQKRWIAFLSQKGGRAGKLKEPPVGSTNNAESYAAAANEYFFAKKCSYTPSTIKVAPPS